MAQDHIWAPLAEGQPTHHREPGQMIYLQDTEAAQFYYILTGTPQNYHLSAFSQTIFVNVFACPTSLPSTKMRNPFPQ